MFFTTARHNRYDLRISDKPQICVQRKSQAVISAHSARLGASSQHSLLMGAPSKARLPVLHGELEAGLSLFPATRDGSRSLFSQQEPENSVAETGYVEAQAFSRTKKPCSALVAGGVGLETSTYHRSLNNYPQCSELAAGGLKKRPSAYEAVESRTGETPQGEAQTEILVPLNKGFPGNGQVIDPAQRLRPGRPGVVLKNEMPTKTCGKNVGEELDSPSVRLPSLEPEQVRRVL